MVTTAFYKIPCEMILGTVPLVVSIKELFELLAASRSSVRAGYTGRYCLSSHN